MSRSSPTDRNSVSSERCADGKAIPRGHQWDSIGVRIYKEIKESILRGDIRPGEHIPSAVLAERFRVSPTPVREALSSLVRDGLAVYEPYRGVRAIELSHDLIRHIYEVRKALELISWTKLAELIREKPDYINLEPYYALAFRGDTFLKAGDLKAYSDTDVELHLAIAKLSQNGQLIAVMTVFMDKVRWLMTHTASLGGRPYIANAEHKVLLDAVKNGDPDGVGQLVSRHLDHAEREMLEALSRSSEVPQLNRRRQV